MWRSAVEKFSRGSIGFDRSFSKSETVRVVGIDQIRECSRMNRINNKADDKNAQSEG